MGERKSSPRIGNDDGNVPCFRVVLADILALHSVVNRRWRRDTEISCDVDEEFAVQKCLGLGERLEGECLKTRK